MPCATQQPQLNRFTAVDALRGAAMLWMTAYHFAFDLNHFGHIQQNFYADPFWTWQRTAIVSLFLLTAGCGQALAVHHAQGWPRFWRRWAQIAFCALLVTASSYAMYPGSYIYFGVLHGLAVMLILSRLLAGWSARHGWAAGLLGAVALLAPQGWGLILSRGGWGEGAELFNSRLLNWLGLITAKPITEDYVPLLPWLGVMLWGLAGGQWLLRRRPAWLQGEAAGTGLVGARGAVMRPLAWLGRWSLPYYMAHQPVLMGALMAVAALK